MTDGERADFRRVLYERYVSSRPRRKASAKAEWWERKLLPLLDGVDRDAVVLELGAGSGEFLQFLRSRGFANGRGLDVSGEQVGAARAAGADVARGDALEHLRAHPERVACFVCLDVLEHFTRDELVELVPLMLERLEPGGRVVGQTVNMAGLFAQQVAYGDLTHMTYFTVESLESLFRTFGFVDIEFTATGPVAAGLRGTLRVIAWKLVTAVASLLRRIETGKRQRVWTETLLFSARKPPAS